MLMPTNANRKRLQTGGQACRGGESHQSGKSRSGRDDGNAGAGRTTAAGKPGGGATEADRLGDDGEQKEGAELITQEVRDTGRRAAVLLFEADVSEVSVVDAHDAVVLLEEALLLRLASPLQTLDQQAKSPERFKDGCQRLRRLTAGWTPGGRPSGARQRAGTCDLS